MTGQTTSRIDDALRRTAKTTTHEAVCVALGEVSLLDLAKYIEGGLDPQVRLRVQRHLGACPHCRRVQVGLARTMSAAGARSNWVRVTVGATAVAALILLNFGGGELDVQAPAARQVAWSVDVEGALARTRGVEAHRIPLVSRSKDLSVSIDVTSVQDRPDAAQAYRVNADGTLASVPCIVSLIEDEEGTRFVFELDAGSFLDERSHQTLAFLFGSSRSDVVGRDGLRLADVDGGVRWQEYELEVRAR